MGATPSIAARLASIEATQAEILRRLSLAPAAASTDEVPVETLMAELGYKSRSSFFTAVHSKGIPHLRVNKRKVVFYRNEVEAWKRARTKHAA